MLASQVLQLSWLTVAVLTVGVLGLFISCFPLLQTDRRLPKIPGPLLNYFVGLGISLPPYTLTKFRKWAGEYGDIYRVQVGWHHWVVLNSPEAVKIVFDKQLQMPMSDVVVGGMRVPTMSYGPKWRAYQQLCHQILTAKAVNSFIPYQTVEIARLLNDLATKNTDDSAFYKDINRMLFSTLMRAVYGRSTESVNDEDLKYTEQSAKLLSKIQQPGSYIEDMRMWNRLKEQFTSLSAPSCYAKQMIESDFRQQGLKEEDLAWIAGGLVDAGSATSTATFHNLILYLAAFPEVQETAAAEINRVIGDSRKPAMADIPQLPYVWACIKEVLRICPMPPWAIRHFTDADVVYKDMVITKGTAVICNTVALHYEPKKYPDPMAFRPEDHINNTKFAGDYAAMSDPQARNHFTFGVGRRVCPGTRLVESNLALMLANMLWAFDIQPPLNGEKGKATIDVSDDAFEPYPLRHAKPFKVRFVPQNEHRLEMVLREGREAQKM
ncbi:hypothetical protein COCC4DRAFT_66198 [Bipolaris maydis ATCC 48331]|uniref:O-methylsterigmatocystin oxidoreductase n=1 Tax=Cochliobolus heterostrophus (strain C4 / ATCC 48331 / race T) TaxID=665024 RepID=N4WHG4_COCH4|nr:uncharacterized protein COCC4DRAFT_66198 [Bipolaris maydis ATCC 48331]ENH99773.1 hypothetical protein COCC4DRAFT_66198 [Bipolaris maydis ATCC 48331]KAJ6265153.1 cytochrome P450 [Bipolaris maydis]KAJ6280883.1 cytochrome P450 [Bipolaris maydis]